jgi:hypothetical protein
MNAKERPPRHSEVALSPPVPPRPDVAPEVASTRSRRHGALAGLFVAATLGMTAALSGLSGVLPSPLRSFSLPGLLNPARLFGSITGAIGTPVSTRSPGGTVVVGSLAGSEVMHGLAPAGEQPAGEQPAGEQPGDTRTGVGKHPTRWEFRFARSGFKGTFRQWRRLTERRLARRRQQHAHAHHGSHHARHRRHHHRHGGHHLDRRPGRSDDHRRHGGGHRSAFRRAHH